MLLFNWWTFSHFSLFSIFFIFFSLLLLFHTKSNRKENNLISSLDTNRRTNSMIKMNIYCINLLFFYLFFFLLILFDSTFVNLKKKINKTNDASLFHLWCDNEQSVLLLYFLFRFFWVRLGNKNSQNNNKKNFEKTWTTQPNCVIIICTRCCRLEC